MAYTPDNLPKPNNNPLNQEAVSLDSGPSIKRVLDAVLDRLNSNSPRDLVYYEIDKGTAKLWFKLRA